MRSYNAFTEPALVTKRQTADGQMQSRGAVNITGPGWITGWRVSGASGDAVVLHEGTSASGAVIEDVPIGLTAVNIAALNQDSWIYFTTGVYANVTFAGSGSVVLTYRLA